MVSPQRDRRHGDEPVTREVIDDRFGLGITIHVATDQNRHGARDWLSGKIVGDTVPHLDKKIRASVHVADDVDPGPRSDARAFSRQAESHCDSREAQFLIRIPCCFDGGRDG